ncbi:hypothetical protein Bca4012_077004 [Brassica carinata]|uniref:Uncharacterized protein n=1 Tax=Brassica carinata TaxID=52824 RepID=A0A8X7U773_BRACI|nr:hypothetical protein Bca52824_072735 [Brassica carinata]
MRTDPGTSLVERLITERVGSGGIVGFVANKVVAREKTVSSVPKGNNMIGSQQGNSKGTMVLTIEASVGGSLLSREGAILGRADYSSNGRVWIRV